MRRSPQTLLCTSGIWNGGVQCSGLGSILLRQQLQCHFKLCVHVASTRCCILHVQYMYTLSSSCRAAWALQLICWNCMCTYMYMYVYMYCLILCSLLLPHTTHHFFALPLFKFGCFSGAPHSCWTLQPALAGRMWILTQ